jgi:two-component system, LytTR family, sensor kinase
MARSFPQLYLRCQLIGWSSVLVWLIGMGLFVPKHFSGSFIWFQLIFCLAGLLASHLLRNFIRRHRYRELPFRQALPRLLLATVAAAVIGSVLRFAAMRYSIIFIHPPQWLTHQNIFADTFGYLLVLMPWTTIYCLHFNIMLRQKLNLKDRQLHLLLKQKELSVVEPPVDIDLITGSLDRIRSLIDEDPASAPEGINAFSNMLRKGRLKTD